MLDRSSVRQITTSDDTRTRVYNSGQGDSLAHCDVVIDNVPPGTHTIDVEKQLMRLTRAHSVCGVLLAALFFSACESRREPLDLLIISARIVDGTGNPWHLGDVGVRHGRIVSMDSGLTNTARVVIDGRGLYVAPGFIDVHTHVDRQIRDEPTVKNYLLQGVTTIVAGNCGGSQLPLRALFDDLREVGLSLNFASLVGHNTIRHEVMGEDDRDPSPEELTRMQTLVEREMQAGAIGLSTGLAYLPGRFSTTPEIVALARVTRPYQGVYASHIRNQGDGIREAIEEAVSVGEAAGIPVVVSHIKLARESVWGKHALIFGPMESARQRGLEVYMDQYPYTATSSGFGSSFPSWAMAGGQQTLVERLADPASRAKIRQALIDKRLVSQRGINRLETIYVSRNEKHPEYQGKNLAEILSALGRPQTVEVGAELIMEMQETDEPRGVFFQMDEKDVQVLMQAPYTMIASDGKVEIPGVEVPHPRAYGTYPRLLGRYVRELGVLTLPDAVRKMTSLPAQAMGFHDRGVMKVGARADLVVFDLEQVGDRATFAKPHQYPSGIRWVIVNGVVAAQDLEVTPARPGQVLGNPGRRG